MKKRWLAAALALSMVFAGGCGSSGKEDEGSAKSDSGDQVTITYMQWQQEFSTAAIKLADAYMEEHPNVKVEVITNSDGYSENLKAALVAGNVPEIFVTEGYENMKSYEEYLTDLSEEDQSEILKLGIQALKGEA